MDKAEFLQAIRDRTQHIRQQCGFSLSEISTLLEISDEAYCKYEYVRAMPLYQVARFTSIFAIDPGAFLSLDLEVWPAVDPAHIDVLRQRIAAFRSHDTAPDEPDDAAEVRDGRQALARSADATFAARLQK